jgi:hypothetical protein
MKACDADRLVQNVAREPGLQIEDRMAVGTRVSVVAVVADPMAGASAFGRISLHNLPQALPLDSYPPRQQL